MHRNAVSAAVKAFSEGWKPFDWTEMLHDEKASQRDGYIEQVTHVNSAFCFKLIGIYFEMEFINRLWIYDFTLRVLEINNRRA